MDKRLVVVIDDWPADSLYPVGHYVRTLGVIGEKDTETEVRGGGAHVKQYLLTGAAGGYAASGGLFCAFSCGCVSFSPWGC